MKYLTLVGMLLATPLSANCLPKSVMVHTLVVTHNERLMMGMKSKGTSFEVWKNDEKKTWTIIENINPQTACVRAVGIGFEIANPHGDM